MVAIVPSQNLLAIQRLARHSKRTVEKFRALLLLLSISAPWLSRNPNPTQLLGGQRPLPVPDCVGTRGTIGQLLPVLVPVVLPDASRRVPLTNPEEPLVVWLPVDRFDASRKSVRLPLVPLAREVALPSTRPLASR
jgi:hypothetical protein